MQILESRMLRVAALAMLALLTACGAPPGLVRPNEPVKVSRVFEVTSPIEWARYRFPRGEIWTVDGTSLNRILYYTNIRDKYHVFADYRATKRRPDGAFFRKGMDASELEAVFRDGFTALGLANVKTTNLHPIQLGGETAFRFDMAFDVGNGLSYLGHVTFFERKEKLNFIWFSAPAEYYYPRDEKAVEQILADLRIRK